MGFRQRLHAVAAGAVKDAGFHSSTIDCDSRRALGKSPSGDPLLASSSTMDRTESTSSSVLKTWRERRVHEASGIVRATMRPCSHRQAVITSGGTLGSENETRPGATASPPSGLTMRTAGALARPLVAYLARARARRHTAPRPLPSTT